MIRTEIGSEFWNIPLKKCNNAFFPENTGFFLTGRGALHFIITDILKQRKIKTVAMPSWCCDSMIVPFLNMGIDVKFYSVLISKDKLFVNTDKARNCDAILVMDYFGYDCQTEITDFNGIVIRDLTHSMFSKQYNDADYYFGSLRKWAGFYTGGFAWKTKTSWNEALPSDTDNYYVELRKNFMKEKAAYISGNSDCKDYLLKISAGEEYIESHYQGAADETDVENAIHLDVEYIKETRRKNAAFLLSHLSDAVIFNEIKANDCPLFVPVLVPKEKRDKLRYELIKKDIYLPIHWPLTKYHTITEEEKSIYDCELSLVCDQRYGLEDMDRMVTVIKKIWGNML